MFRCESWRYSYEIISSGRDSDECLCGDVLTSYHVLYQLIYYLFIIYLQRHDGAESGLSGFEEVDDGERDQQEQEGAQESDDDTEAWSGDSDG